MAPLDDILARAMEVAPTALLVIDAEGRIVFANAALLAMFGYARDELAGQRVEVLVPDAVREAHCAGRAALSSLPGRSGMLTVCGRRRDGSELLVEVQVDQAVTERGPMVVASLRDMGDRVELRDSPRDPRPTSRADPSRLASLLGLERRGVFRRPRASPSGRLDAHPGRRSRCESLIEALRASEERFRLAFEEAPVGMGMVGLDGRIVRMNRALCRMIGYAEEELIGGRFDLVTHPDDVAGDRAAVEALRSGRAELVRREKRLIARGGEVIHIVLTTVALHDPTGQPIHFIGHVQDLREQRRAEEAQRRSETMYRALFELAPEGVVVIDREDRVTDPNPAFCSMFGYLREELAGKPLRDFVPERDGDQPARTREQLRAAGTTLVTEWKGRRRDGGWQSAEVSVTLLPDESLLGFVRDVRERKRLERERETALRRLRTVIDRCPIGIGLMYADDPTRPLLNPRGWALLGRPEDPLHIGVMYCPDGTPLPFDESPAIRALRGETVDRMELVHQAPSGRRTPLVAYAAPLHDADGAIEGAVVAFEDTSAEKDLERLRSEWTSIVAHDLRQPVTAIQLFAKAVARATEHEGATRRRVAQIQDAARTLERMIGDLLDLAQAEVRRLPLARRLVDLPALLASSVTRANLEAPDREVSLSVRGDVPLVDADPDRVAQITDNLLGNAVKYGAPGTPITVRVERAEREVTVTVENEGPGVAPEDLPLLFERFHRGTQSGILGVGLGLYIARQLVEAHGGTIGVESAPAGPTRFRFTLPINRPT